MLDAEEPSGIGRGAFIVAVADRGGRQQTVGAAGWEDVAFALFRAVAADYPDDTVILMAPEGLRELAVRHPRSGA